MKLSFETDPSQYRHWTLAVDGEIARLIMKVTPFGGANTELELKSNSYDLSVDIELADAVQRLRFTHPQVKACVITSGHEKIFCAGANIYMLASSTHPFKVNFCKFTNETRLAMEDASQNSGLKFLAACNGATAGGGYELALACDEIVFIDDGSSTFSLPEVPLLGVLPGTGGLTRVVDKRKVRRDLADAFSTLAEGVKGKRAVEWGLVDAGVPRSKFADAIAQPARDLAARAPKIERGKGIEPPPPGEARAAHGARAGRCAVAVALPAREHRVGHRPHRRGPQAGPPGRRTAQGRFVVHPRSAARPGARPAPDGRDGAELLRGGRREVVLQRAALRVAPRLRPQLPARCRRGRNVARQLERRRAAGLERSEQDADALPRRAA